MSQTPCVECGTTNWYWRLPTELPNGEVICDECE